MLWLKLPVSNTVLWTTSSYAISSHIMVSFETLQMTFMLYFKIRSWHINEVYIIIRYQMLYAFQTGLKPVAIPLNESEKEINMRIFVSCVNCQNYNYNHLDRVTTRKRCYQFLHFFIGILVWVSSLVWEIYFWIIFRLMMDGWKPFHVR